MFEKTRPNHARWNKSDGYEQPMLMLEIMCLIFGRINDNFCLANTTDIWHWRLSTVVVRLLKAWNSNLSWTANMYNQRENICRDAGNQICVINLMMFRWWKIIVKFEERGVERHRIRSLVSRSTACNAVVAQCSARVAQFVGLRKKRTDRAKLFLHNHISFSISFHMEPPRGKKEVWLLTLLIRKNLRTVLCLYRHVLKRNYH